MTNIKHSQNKIVPNIVNNQTLQIVMKKLFLFTLIISSSIMAFGQSKMACCKQSATQQFAMLASDKKFVMSHPKPLPFHFQSSIGKAITYPTPDGRTADAYELKAIAKLSLGLKSEACADFSECLLIGGGPKYVDIFRDLCK